MIHSGQKLNRYQVVSLLGEGGMGEVYKGHDPLLERDVAIKVMHPHFARQPNFRERFLQEARTAARLDHPGIVKVHDSGEVSGMLYIVMEYLAGANLRKMLDDLSSNRRWIVLPEGVEIVRQICLALDYAHRQGVLHRDIKPDNIMLKPEGIESLPYHPVLTDLGLAKLIEGLPITRDGETLGTPGYMSPEQTLGQPLDARSDVYSLGILLYEICAGQLPFPAKTISEAIRYHTKEPAPSPRKIRVGIPGDLEAVILKALSKKPEDRFSKAVELAQALREVQKPTVQEKDRQEQGAVVSLVTQYQQSLIEMRGMSVLDEFPPPAPTGQDRITIMEPDKTSRTIPIPPHGLSIGRGPENDIVLNDSKASRKHAKVEISGLDYRIIDLKSTNGTFLGDIKLLAGVGEVWRPDKALRIGNTWLRLERAASDGSSAGFAPDATVPDIIPDRNAQRVEKKPMPVTPKGVDARLGITAQETNFRVDPGSGLPLTFTLSNMGQTVDHLRAKLTGVPAQWITSEPPELHLMPRQQQDIHFTLLPPRSPQTLAGEYTPVLHVASIDDPSQIYELPLHLTVDPFFQFILDLRPRRSSGMMEGNFTLQASNQSNAEMKIKLEGIDPEDGCLYYFSPAQPSLPAGSESQIQIRVQPRQPLVSGQAKVYPFTITARSQNVEGNPLVQQVTGEWEHSSAAFELSLYPSKQRGAGRSVYNVKVANRSASALTVQLEASDPEGACHFSFGEASLIIAAGAERITSLTARPGRALPGESSKTYYFTVTGRVAGISANSRQAMGEWEQIPPTYELKLLPASQEGGAAGLFTIQVKNQSDLPLTFHLNAVGPDRDTRITVDPAQFVLPEGREVRALLKVQSKVRLSKNEIKSIPVTVTAQPSEAPGLIRQAQAEWRKFGGFRLNVFSFWRYSLAWIILVLGWGFAALGSELFLAPLGGSGRIADLLMFDFNLMDTVAFSIAFAIQGLIYGVLVGFVTWLALKIDDTSLPFSTLIGILFGWMVGWALGLAGILGPNPFGYNSRIFAVAAGLIGGLFTASACRKTQPKIGLGLAFIVFLSWPLGQVFIWMLVNSGIDFGEFYYSTRFDLTGFLSSALAGIITLLMLAIPRRE